MKKKIFVITLFVLTALVLALVVILLYTLFRHFVYNNDFLTTFKFGLTQWYFWLLGLVIDIALALFYWEKGNKSFIKTAKNNTEFGTAEWLLDARKKISKKSLFKFNEIYPQSDESGFVIWMEKNSRNGLYFHQINKKHLLILGGTGSGKTQKIIMPTIFYNAQMKTKPNMVISDVKGELADKFSDYLKNQGYNVYIFNLINPLDDINNNCFNPLTEIRNSYLVYLKEKNINALAETEEMINILTSALLPSSDDPKDEFWISQARNIIKGLVWLVLETLEINANAVSEIQFNLSSLTNMLNNMKQLTALLSLLSNKKPESRAKQYLINSLFAEEPTRSGFLTQCQKALAIFYSIKIKYLTQKTTLNLDEFFKKPSVLFIKVPEADKTNYSLVTMLINLLYIKGVSIANANSKKALDRELLFVLDEFANMPKIQEFDNKISTCRSKNIFFSLVIQSYNQIKTAYSASAKTIMDNIQTKIYLQTELADAENLSKEIGNQTVVQTNFSSNGKNESKSDSLAKIPLINPADIVNLNQPLGIITTSKTKPSLVRFTFAHETKINDIKNNENKQLIPAKIDETECWINLVELIDLFKPKNKFSQLKEEQIAESSSYEQEYVSDKKINKETNNQQKDNLDEITQRFIKYISAIKANLQKQMLCELKQKMINSLEEELKKVEELRTKSKSEILMLKNSEWNKYGIIDVNEEEIYFNQFAQYLQKKIKEEKERDMHV